MTIPYNSDSLPNILRLQGLKNTSRRVKPPMMEEDMDYSNNQVPYLPESQTAPIESPNNGLDNAPPPRTSMRKMNEPEMDNGGELTSQSYDVRANEIENPFIALGKYLGSAIRQSYDTNPKQQAGVQSPPPGFEEPNEAKQNFSNLEQNLFPQKREEAQKRQALLEARNAQQQQDLLQQNEEIPQAIGAGVQVPDRRSIDEAMQNPYEISVYGSANQVLNDPILQSEFKAETGIDYTPQLAEQINEAESVLNEIQQGYEGINSSLQDMESFIISRTNELINNEGKDPETAKIIADYEANVKKNEGSLTDAQNAYSQTEQALKDRILNNQATDSDKFLIGMALFMPLLIGGFFGKEAGLGALSGTAKGFADIYGNRQKEIRADEESLLDINKNKALIGEKLGNLGLERAKFKAGAQKEIAETEKTRQAGIREGQKSLLDVQQETGRNQERLAALALNKAKLGPELKKNLPEQPQKHLLGMPTSEFTDPETGKTEKIVEVLPGLVAKAKYMTNDSSVNRMRDKADALSAQKGEVDKTTNLADSIIHIVSQLPEKNPFSKLFTSIVTQDGRATGLLNTLSQEVEFQGREVNAGVILNSLISQLANSYRVANKQGQPDKAVLDQIARLMENPEATMQTNKSTIDQMLLISQLGQEGLINSAKNQGFYPQFIEKEFVEPNEKIFKNLKKLESIQETEKFKKELYGI